MTYDYMFALKDARSIQMGKFPSSRNYENMARCGVGRTIPYNNACKKLVSIASGLKKTATRSRWSLTSMALACGRRRSFSQAPFRRPLFPEEREGWKKPALYWSDYLEREHMGVEAVRFDAETAKALGIGFASRGTHERTGRGSNPFGR